MTVIAPLADGKKLCKETHSGPSAYPEGGTVITVQDVNQVIEILCVGISSGYVTDVEKSTVLSANHVSVPVFYIPDPTTISGSDSPLKEVTSGTDLSGTKITIVYVGY